MNFIEAVQALKNGRCEGIKRECWVTDAVLISGGTELKFYDTTYIPYMIDFLADDWELVNERPQYEEVEVVRWAVVGPQGQIMNTFGTKLDDEQLANTWPGYHQIRLAGVDKRPIKPKVKKRASMGTACLLDRRGDYPPHAKVYAEWEE